MQFSPEKQKLVCAYCDSEFSVEEFDEKKGVKAEEHENAFEQEADDKYYQATVFTCPQCGGELISTSDTAATFCSFCGASVLLESRISKQMKPDFIIPFKKSKEECKNEYKKMLSKAWFAPSAMKKESEIDKFRSIYMPYWIYSYDYSGKLQVKGSTSKRRGDYIYTKHYNIVSDIDLDYEGIAYDASSSFSDNLSEAVAPFNVNEKEDFRTAYMTGHYADTKDVDADVYEPDAAGAVRDHAAETLAEKTNYGTYGADKSDIAKGFEPVLKNVKLGFFPVWFLSGRNKKGDRVSYAVMNGQTGKIAADLPVAFSKYLLGSILLAIPIYLILTFLLNLTLTPRVLLVVSLALGLVSLLIANSQVNRVYTRENNLDDKGWLAMQGRTLNKTKTIKTKSGKEIRIKLKDVVSSIGSIGAVIIWLVIFSYLGAASVILIVLLVIYLIGRPLLKKIGQQEGTGEIYPAPFKDKLKVLLKPAIGMIASLVVIIWNPPDDPIPYGVAIAALALIAWSFADIISAHNKLSERKLPQLGRRGGDEDA